MEIRIFLWLDPAAKSKGFDGYRLSSKDPIRQIPLALPSDLVACDMCVDDILTNHIAKIVFVQAQRIH